MPAKVTLAGVGQLTAKKRLSIQALKRRPLPSSTFLIQEARHRFQGGRTFIQT